MGAGQLFQGLLFCALIHPRARQTMGLPTTGEKEGQKGLLLDRMCLTIPSIRRST